MKNESEPYAVGSAGSAFVHDKVPSADIVHVFGDVDLSTSQEFENALTRASRAGSPLIIDLSECRFIDSSAIAVMIRTHERLGSDLRLVVPDAGNIARVLSICKLDDVFVIAPDLEAAVVA